MNRILVIRGGAIGDFILTLPGLKALRDAYPQAYVEILGYKHIAALAEKRFYAQAVRSIEYGPLSRFFAAKSDLPSGLMNHFASFDLIISYLYDPDRIFEANLRQCGLKTIVRGPAKIEPPKDGFAVATDSCHAARQLAKPVEELGIEVADLAATLFPSAEDRQFAHDFLRDLAQPIIAVHPGSGSEKKNWPVEKWLELSRSGAFPAVAGRSGKRSSLILVSGEADEMQCAQFEREWRNGHLLVAKNLPLTQLAAVLSNSIFVGHDSGISHLAAAAGANCILLFGPTDPAIWAPLNQNVRVIRAPDSDLQHLEVDVVREAIDHALMRIGIST